MSSDAPRGVETRARVRKRERDGNAQEAIPGLPEAVVVTNILKSESFDDPADLARLRTLSRPMRDAVRATKRDRKELDTITP